MFTVTVVDETTAGTRGEAWHLEIFEETLTLRELIRRRVFQEASEHNARSEHNAKSERRVDPQVQAASALAAFERNGFVVLVDDRQVEDLDARLELAMNTQVTFLKLVPLVGG